MTLSQSWSWKPNDRMRSLAECLHALVRAAGGDGNLLLNVGPMPDGRIEPRQCERLREIGAWLASYGESIYSTRGGPYLSAAHLSCTRRNQTIYLHILDWPEEKLRLPALPASILSSRVLSGGAARVLQSPTGLEISIPQADRHSIDTIVAIDLDKPAMALDPIPVASLNQPLTTNKPASASSVREVLGNVRRYGADKAVDGNPDTRWAGAASATTG